MQIAVDECTPSMKYDHTRRSVIQMSFREKVMEKAFVTMMNKSLAADYHCKTCGSKIIPFGVNLVGQRKTPAWCEFCKKDVKDVFNNDRTDES